MPWPALRRTSRSDSKSNSSSSSRRPSLPTNSPQSTSSGTNRTPLAPLKFDTQAPMSAGTADHSSSSPPDQTTTAKYSIARPIVTNRDDDSSVIISRRKPSQPGTPTSSSSRRTPSDAYVQSRRPSIPSAQLKTTPQPTSHYVQNQNISTADLYANLATYNFGAASSSVLSSSSSCLRRSPSPSDESINPLTNNAANININIDVTPRPSVSSVSLHPNNEYAYTSHPSQTTTAHVHPTSPSRNLLPPLSPSPSHGRGPTSPPHRRHPNNTPSTRDKDRSPSQTRSIASLSDTSSHSHHTFGASSRVSVSSNTSLSMADTHSRTHSRASHGTGTGTGTDDFEFSSDEEYEYEYDEGEDGAGMQIEISSLMWDDDRDRASLVGGGGGGSLHGGVIPEERRGSLPMAIPGATITSIQEGEMGNNEDFYAFAGTGRNREGSLATLRLAAVRRPSRSLDDDLDIRLVISSGVGVEPASGSSTDPVAVAGGLSEPHSKGDWKSLEDRDRAKGKERERAQVTQPIPPHVQLQAPPPQSNPLDGFDQDWLADLGQGLRSAGNIDVSEYVRPPTSAIVSERRPSTQSWMNGWGIAGRKMSTATVGTLGPDDTFERHLRMHESKRDLEWTFKKEKADGGVGGVVGVVEKGKQKDVPKVGTGMQVGSQEIWRNELVGRFKVNRSAIATVDPDKPPQQRLSILRFPDPYLQVKDVVRMPIITVHKHSKAIAFSIGRQHKPTRTQDSSGGLAPPISRSRGPAPVSSYLPRSSHIMLAPKAVQLQYTNTTTTRRLDTHGLLEDRNITAKRHKREKERREEREVRKMIESDFLGAKSKGKNDKRKEKEKEKDKDKDKNVLDRGVNSSTGTASTSRSQTNSSGSIASSHDRLVAPPPPMSAPIIHTYPPMPLDAIKHQPSLDNLRPSSMRTRRRRRDSLDFDSEEDAPRQRTSYSETYGSDPSFVENWSKQVYEPPWITTVSRQKLKEHERVVTTLNTSMTGVGLIPVSNPSSRSKSQKSSNKTSSSEKIDIFPEVPNDSLFMLLPLWPGETDAVSEKQYPEEPTRPYIAMENRLYLLVFYVPNVPGDSAEAEHRGDGNKKKARQSQTSSGGGHVSKTDDRSVLLASFHVNARLVGYDELKLSGVRIPDDGLYITGSMNSALETMPSPNIPKNTGDYIIGICESRNSGMKFIPDGLVKMGLCMPIAEPVDRPIPSAYDDQEHAEDEIKLTPIGRAAVEMAWVGCMALTSFGSAV